MVAPWLTKLPVLFQRSSVALPFTIARYSAKSIGERMKGLASVMAKVAVSYNWWSGWCPYLEIWSLVKAETFSATWNGPLMAGVIFRQTKFIWGVM